MTIADNLKMIRIKLKLTQDDFANKLGVSRYSIIKYELGKTQPSTDFYKLLIDIFDVNINFVLTGIGTMFVRKDFEEIFSVLGIPRNSDTEELLERLRVPVIRKALCAELSVINNKYRDTISAQEAKLNGKVIQYGKAHDT
jgi:DNA-binding XRE family transcriptional regulator